ncbi:hypothetical protein ACOI1H_14740 [Loktanella sp. DJP18]|uniref:hypothetical protein n=1 Tax=Loktanella sp. DJP18 TaxID=3409788 RepID=UPI003BB6E1C1
MSKHIDVTDISRVNPMATLSVTDGFVLIVTDSGYVNHLYSAHVARRKGDLFLNVGGDDIVANYGGEALGWMPLPFCEAEVDAARKAHKALLANQRPYVDGTAAELIQFARECVSEVAGAIGPRRALMKLHQRIGEDMEGDRLPADPTLELIRCDLTTWVKAVITDAHAVKAIRKRLQS